MHALLTKAADALSRNDAAALESLCARMAAQMSEPGRGLSADERADLQAAIHSFQRQVLAARTNLVLRERLLAGRAKETTPWVR